MPQSFTQLYAHLIFSTRNRRNSIDDSIRATVHAYLATLIRNLECPFVVVGGVSDHVHMLFDMGKKYSPIQIVEHTKRESSKFIKTLGVKYSGFYWQRGYAFFSVSPTHRESVEAYIRNQEEHHKTRDFKDELRDFCRRYGIELDERYAWD